MLKKAKEIWTAINKDIIVNQRELVLGLAVCTLAGVVIGTFLSPNVTVTIGSNNVLAGKEEPETAKVTDD